MSDPRDLRIAFSGSAGTGKTTLAQALASKLGLPYIPEGMRARLEMGLELHTLTAEALQELLLELWAEQKALEDQAQRDAGGFVADRSPVDFFAFWLLYRCGPRARTDAFHREARERTARLHRIVLLPWGAIPLVADGVRTPDPWRQRHYQALLEGLLLREVRAERMLWIDGEQTVEARLDRVLAGLAG